MKKVCLSLLLALFLLAQSGGFAAGAGSQGIPSPFSGETRKGGIIPPAESREIHPGVTYTLWRDKKNLAGEELLVYVLEVDLKKNRDLEILPVIAKGRIGDTERVSSMAKRHGALGAINGGFFHSAAMPVPTGNLVIEGRPLSLFDYYRTSLAFTHREGGEHLEVLMGYFSPLLEAYLPGGKARIRFINGLSAAAGVHLFTPEWGREVAFVEGALNAAFVRVKEGTYMFVSAGAGALPVPEEGLVLRFIGPESRALAEGLVPGNLISLHYAYDRQFWGEIRHLLTAGPLLVEGGEPVFQAVQEGFWGSALEPNPRSALGVTERGSILLVVAERKEPGGRVGLTFEEMALLMAELGAREAIGLDGGGSSTLYVEGEVVNGARTRERAVANALLILAGPRLYLNGERIYPDIPPLIAGGRVLVP